LVNYASGIIGNRSHAEDVVQEAYIRFSAAGVATGEVLEVAEPQVAHLLQAIARDLGYRLVDYRLQLFGERRPG
jgi:hypothetical protein